MKLQITQKIEVINRQDYIQRTHTTQRNWEWSKRCKTLRHNRCQKWRHCKKHRGRFVKRQNEKRFCKLIVLVLHTCCNFTYLCADLFLILLLQKFFKSTHQSLQQYTTAYYACIVVRHTTHDRLTRLFWGHSGLSFQTSANEPDDQLHFNNKLDKI